MVSFRSVLREATRPEHDRLDALFSAVDIATPDGFARFISVHEACFRVMAENTTTGSQSHLILPDMVTNLVLDLEVLGIKPLRHETSITSRIDPLAIDYLVAGSRLGSKVLRKRWISSSDPTVLRANNYFDATVDPAMWPATCDALADIRVNSARASAIKRDSRSLFNLFLDVTRRTAVMEALA